MTQHQNQKKNQEFDIAGGRLLYDNVLLKPVVIEHSGGIIRPQNYDEKPEVGRVMAVGEGRIFDNGTIVPLKVKVGDRVLFQKYSSVKVRSGGQDYLLIREEDVYIIEQ